MPIPFQLTHATYASAGMHAYSDAKCISKISVRQNVVPGDTFSPAGKLTPFPESVLREIFQSIVLEGRRGRTARNGGKLEEKREKMEWRRRCENGDEWGSGAEKREKYYVCVHHSRR